MSRMHACLNLIVEGTALSVKAPSRPIALALFTKAAVRDVNGYSTLQHLNL